MKTLFYSLAIILIAFNSLAAFGTLASIPQTCRMDLSDPYAPDARMIYGKHKGHCIDTSAKRAVKVLKLTPEILEIANFRHQGKYYRAILPRENFENLSYMVIDLNGKKITEYLGIMFMHTEFKVRTRQPISLYSQKQQSNEPVYQINEFIISYNYMAPQGVEYNPQKGLDENLYASVIQMFSIADELKIRAGKKQNIYELKLTAKPDVIEKFVTTAALKSDRVQYSLKYDTWTNNCTTQAFRIFDEAWPPQDDVKSFRFKLIRLQDTSLKPAIQALKDRGLVGPRSSIQSFNAQQGLEKFESPGNEYFNSWIGKAL